MPLALQADSSAVAYSPSRPATRRSTKHLVAGIAVASAGVIAVNPVTPSLPDIQQRAVELAAVANPLVTLQQTLTNTFNNLSSFGTAFSGATNTTAQALTNPAVYAALTNFITANVTNPGPLLNQLANFQATYGAQIGAANAASNAALQTALNNLPATLTNTFNFLTSGQFVEAFSELNIYFLVQLIERPGNPLVPLLNIPGDVLAALPGGQVAANVVDALLTRGVFSGLTRALFVAPITATLQTAEILDAVRAAVVVGDFGTAINELINMPIRVANAFINGYVPNFPTRSLFQGLLSPNGPLDYFLVDLPNAIFGALNASVAPPVTAPVALAAASSAASVASTDLSLTGTTLSLTETASDAAPATPAAEGAATGTPATAETPADPAPETPAAAPVAEETTPAPTTPAETSAEETAAEGTATEGTADTATGSTGTTGPTGSTGSNKPTSTWGSGSAGSGSSTVGSSTETSGTTGSSTTGSSTGSSSTGGSASGSASESTGSASGSSTSTASSGASEGGSSAGGSTGGSDSGSSGGGE
ncbi:hypothetical protein [Mycolicibacterium grossiae]|uniref:hypothetical protein n=2 Tax=Mycolicibacterium grossiae TaxID=1552759 RepID=UPI0011F3DC46|nr:hypothetical protein [Mycolicibacterium grossiae]QEM44100.1 hypothetical protein FZ046_04260 [Mycolicibacterium grossiae]